MPRSSFNVELDAANATWLLSDVALLSTKTGELLLLTLVYDGRYVTLLFSSLIPVLDVVGHMFILVDWQLDDLY